MTKKKTIQITMNKAIKKKNFQVKIQEGDAIIVLKSNRVVELIFAEDDETILREQESYEQEVYKTAVQFALMIDTFLKNGEGLDNVIMHSDTGSIVAELLGSKDMLSITLAGLDEDGFDVEREITVDDFTGKEDLKDNVVDATKRFIKKEDNDGNK